MAQSRREREKELQEIDMYDVLVPELAEPYQKRLESASQFLDKHVDMSVPEGPAVRRSILGNTGLIQGDTNFWGNPYNYTHPKTRIDNKMINTLDIGSYGPMLRGAMSHGNPYSMYVNPNPKGWDKKDADFRAGELLAHEGVHGGQILYHNRVKQHYKGKGFPDTDTPWGWMPEFTPEFLTDLKALGEKTKGEYGGSGWGWDAAETQSYLAGYEAEMPRGKTLKQHEVLGPVFAKHPGMYDAYLESMKKVRDQLKK